MKAIFTPLTITFVLLGCGLMNNSKDTPEETTRIHVPQKITVEIPKALQQTTSSSNNQKTTQRYWYN